MRYGTGGAFRRALEDRLRTQSLRTGLPLVRLRKMVAFERLLARLVADRPDGWLLKGGLALQWRLGERARTTQDLDVELVGPREDLHASVVRAALKDMGDWFRYLVEQPARTPVQGAAGLRFAVRAMLDGRPFETFHLDVGWGDPVTEPPDVLTVPSLLEFAGIAPFAMPCYPIAQHLAEKVHAYARPHIGGESSRVKDLVDILLLARTESLDAVVVYRALQATFRERQTHPMPNALPDPPASWALPFSRLAGEVGPLSGDLAEGMTLARRLLDPVLQGRARGPWDPESGHWTR